MEFIGILGTSNSLPHTMPEGRADTVRCKASIQTMRYMALWTLAGFSRLMARQPSFRELNTSGPGYYHTERFYPMKLITFQKSTKSILSKS